MTPGEGETLGGDVLKSELNFKVIKENQEYDMHELGIWVNSFHIFSPNSEIETVEIPGMDGAHLVNSKMGIRQLEIDLLVDTDSLYKLDNKKHLIYNIFYDKTPFKIIRDLNGKELRVIQEGDYDIENITCSDGIFEINNLKMIDPYLYGNEQEYDLNDVSVIKNEGTETTDHIIELTAKEKATYAMINNENDEYNLIGFPVEEDGNEQIVDERVSIFKDDGSNIDSWMTNNIQVDTNFIDLSGSMMFDGTGFRTQSYGTGDRMHGPSIMKELPKGVQDFEIVTDFDIISQRPEDNWRMEVYFYDENLNMLGKMGLKDNSRTFFRRFGLGRVGSYRGAGLNNGYAIGGQNYVRDDLGTISLMHLRVKREGDLYTFYVAEWHHRKHRAVLERKYRDKGNVYQGKLKYIALFIGNYKDRRNPTRLRINGVEVFELRTLTEDMTPYIVYPNDVITFDNRNEDILINGETAMQIKNFGAEFFKLRPGYNQLTISPPGAFSGKISFKEKYK